MPTFHSLPDELGEVEVGAQEPGIRPEHVKAKSHVKLEVCQEEPSWEVVGEARVVLEVPDEAEEAVVGVPGLVRQQGHYAGHIHTDQQGDEDEGLKGKGDDDNDVGDGYYD